MQEYKEIHINNEEFVPVSIKKTGAKRESSLYHFVNDKMKTENTAEPNEFLAKYDCQHSRGDREAYYIRLRNSSLFFETIIDNYELIDCHLSVDKIYSLESSTSHPSCFSASHITLSLKPTSAQNHEGRVIHVYFNQDSQLISDPVRIHQCIIDNQNHVYEQGNLLKNNDEITNEVFSSKIFQEYREALTKLVSDKNETYFNLNSDSYRLMDALANLIRERNFNKIKVTAESLKQLTEKLTHYNDLIIDGRTNQLSHIIAFYEKLCNKSAKKVVVAIENNLEETNSLSQEISSSIQHSSIPSVNQKTEEENLKNKIKDLVQKLISLSKQEEQSNADALITRHITMQEFNETCLYLYYEGSNLKKTKQFIKKQEEKIPRFGFSLLDDFNQLINEGDLDSVKKLYDIVLKQYDLSDLFKNLIMKITNYKVSTKPWSHPDNSPQTIAHNVKIADFFYECSPLYRSIMNRFKLQSFQTNFYLISTLVLCFVNNNHYGFKMLLNQGFSLDTCHFMRGTKTLNALQSIIFLYARNPNSDYVKWMLEKNVSTNFPRQNLILAAIMDVHPKKSNKKSFHKKSSNTKAIEQFINDSNHPHENIDNKLNIYIEIKNALDATISSYLGSYPDLLRLFIEKVDLVESIIVLTKKLGSNTFLSLYELNYNYDQSEFVFIDKESVVNCINNRISQTISNANSEPLNNNFVPTHFYWMNNSTQESNAIYDFVSNFLIDIRSKFKQQEMKEQIKIMVTLSLKIEEQYKLIKSLVDNGDKSTRKEETEELRTLLDLHLSLEQSYRWMLNDHYHHPHAIRLMLNSFKNFTDAYELENSKYSEEISKESVNNSDAMNIVQTTYNNFVNRLLANNLVEKNSSTGDIQVINESKNVNSRNTDPRFFQIAPNASFNKKKINDAVLALQR